GCAPHDVLQFHPFGFGPVRRHFATEPLVEAALGLPGAAALLQTTKGMGAGDGGGHDDASFRSGMPTRTLCPASLSSRLYRFSNSRLRLSRTAGPSAGPDVTGIAGRGDPRPRPGGG